LDLLKDERLRNLHIGCISLLQFEVEKKGKKKEKEGGVVLVLVSVNFL